MKNDAGEKLLDSFKKENVNEDWFKLIVNKLSGKFKSVIKLKVKS